MVGIFGTSTDFNLNFNDNPKNLTDPTADGETHVTHSGGFVQPGTGRTILTDMDINITLNSGILSGSSQEFITATILHEALHAYFAYFGMMDDHNVMVNQYIPWFEDILKTVYPSLPDYQVQALAFGGLTQTMAMSVSIYSTQKSFFDLTNQLFQQGSAGTPCH